MEFLAKYYNKGDAYPPRADKSIIRVYSFMCPYAERVRLVLTAKAIEHEVINVNLLNKPEFLFDKHPLGKVPVIEFDSDDKILIESEIIADYLDETFGDKRQLRSNDPFIRAKDRLFLEELNENLMFYFKIVYSKESKTVLWIGIRKMLQSIEDLLAKRRTQKFLSGDDLPGLLDYMIWPFIERIPLSIAIVSDNKPEEYLQKELPTISDYRKQLLTDSTVATVSPDSNVLLNFVKAAREHITQELVQN